MPPHRLDTIATLLRTRQPACGSTTVVAVDGPSGSGKTGLAERLAELTAAPVLHLEDVYPGWHGLAATPPIIARGVLEAIAVDRIGEAPRWDWTRDRPGDTMRVPPAPLLILDGVGSGSAEIRPFLSLLVWVEAPLDVRKERALARDGDVFAPFWDVWAAQERSHFSADETRRHADVIVRTDA